MSLNAINNYVNNLITLNRDLDPENISMYFKLMEEEASLLLDKAADSLEPSPSPRLCHSA